MILSPIQNIKFVFPMKNKRSCYCDANATSYETGKKSLDDFCE